MRATLDWIRRRELGGLLFVAVAGLVLTFTWQGSFEQQTLALVFLWTIAAQSWNLLYGYAGQLSFGQSVFVGIGAYALVFVLESTGMTPWAAFPIGIAASTVVAVVVGLPTFRLVGAYFALATITLPLIAIAVVDSLNLQERSLPLVGDGLAYLTFREPQSYTLLALAAMLVVLVLVWWIDRTRVGHLLRAIRENQTVAESLGVRTLYWKLFVFALSGAIGATFGVLWVETSLLTVASADVFGLAIGVLMISICLVGGVGRRWGPLVGAAILVPTSEWLNDEFGGSIPGIQLLAYGVVLVVVIVLAPNGIASLWERTPIARWLSGRPETRKGAIGPSPEQAGPRMAREPRAAPGEPLLVLDGVSRSFLGVKAVSDVTLTFPRGGIIGVIGPNGAGKTTLLNMISGLYPADAGSVTFDGTDITGMSPHGRCRLGIARTFQTPLLMSRLTVLDNVAVGAFARTRSVEDARERAAEALAVVGLAGAGGRSVGSLTTLETKLVEIARALSTGPSLLLVDEAMSGLNDSEHETLIDILRRIRGAGISVILIEHAIRSLLTVADELVVLDGGALLTQGEGREVMRDGKVVEAYLGHKWAARQLGGAEPVV